jgi:hypothetical protein
MMVPDGIVTFTWPAWVSAFAFLAGTAPAMGSSPAARAARADAFIMVMNREERSKIAKISRIRV